MYKRRAWGRCIAACKINGTPHLCWHFVNPTVHFFSQPQVMYLTAEPFLTPATLCAKIEQAFGLSLSRKLCYCAIRRAGLTCKRAKKRPKLKPGRREIERDRFRAEIAGRDDSNLIFIDEVGFRDTLSPLYGYARSGEPLSAVAGSTTWKHTTAIVAISASRVVGMKRLEGAATKETFAPSIESLDAVQGQTLGSWTMSVFTNRRLCGQQWLRKVLRSYTPPRLIQTSPD